MTVTVTMAFWGAHPWVRRAVQSIVDQTYRDWRLVIINDADPVPPWPLLDGLLDDPRIVPFDLPVNRGRFFCDAVLLAATPDDLWALQDPDDRAEPDRLERMVPLALETGMAVAPTCLHPRGDDDPLRVHSDDRLDEPAVPSQVRSHVGYGSGVLSTERIRQVGGFHADLRIGYDTFIMNAAKVVGPWRADPTRMLQHKTIRPGSLATTRETRWGSPARMQARSRINRLYRQLRDRHDRGEDTATPVRHDVQPATWALVDEYAEQLRARM